MGGAALLSYIDLLGWPFPTGSQFVDLSLCFRKYANMSVCLFVCLSVCPQGLYFKTLFNGRYISSLQMIFVRRTAYSTLKDLIY